MVNKVQINQKEVYQELILVIHLIDMIQEVININKNHKIGNVGVSIKIISNYIEN